MLGQMNVVEEISTKMHKNIDTTKLAEYVFPY